MYLSSHPQMYKHTDNHSTRQPCPEQPASLFPPMSDPAGEPIEQRQKNVLVKISLYPRPT
jgi:hypothetical protein